jgi:diamine N-acetyltransferase
MISGAKIILRALEPSDIDLMYSWENDMSVWPVSGTITPFSKSTMEQFIQSAHQDIYTNKQLRLAIDYKIQNNNSNETVGYVDLFDFEPSQMRAGVGILIGKPEHRRKGIALEALSLLSNYAFNLLHLHQVYCHIHTNNEPSIRLFTSAGFKCSGELSDWSLINGVWVNVFVMQKINYPI